jgi:biofilm PGA synthesis N-glycosyltransferase PgaC
VSYALVTPVRDDVENLERLAACVAEQTMLPKRWIIVDNGSVDDTGQRARELAAKHDWIELCTSPATTVAEPGAPIVKAFHAGLARLSDPVDVVVKLDADVSFDTDYFERLLLAFEHQPLLGIASGECLELRNREWRSTHVTAGHARGATRAYRWECLQELLPLPERMGWDTADELQANVRGWETGTVRDLAFYHHREVGSRDGLPWTRWVRQGEACHYLGYSLSYLLLRTLHRSIRQPAAVGMLVGYLSAAVRRGDRLDDIAVREHLRSRQSLRRLHLRAREAFGRPTTRT